MMRFFLLPERLNGAAPIFLNRVGSGRNNKFVAGPLKSAEKWVKLTGIKKKMEATDENSLFTTCSF